MIETPVELAVVLVDPTCQEPEVGAGGEAPVLVDEPVLRLDLDVCRTMEQPGDRLPRRLAPAVQQGEHRTWGRAPRRG